MIGRGEALFYHGEPIRRFGGSHGVRDEGILDASLNRPFATFDGVDLLPSTIEKGCGRDAWHHHRASVHRRKQTYRVLARLILQDGGMDLHADEDGKYDLVIGVATGQLEVEEIHAWMKQRTKPLK